MTNKTLIILGVVGVAAYLGYKNRYVFGQAGATLENFDFMGELEKIADWMGLRSVANLSRVDRGLLSNRNVQAMLRVIRQGESNQTDSAYKLIVGGKTFTSFADHPRIFGTPVSTAAGAYQITKTTWDWIKKPMGLADFSPSNQDFAAVGLMAYRGALADVIRGDLAAAIPKLRKEWTSLPGAAETKLLTMQKAREIFVAFGGNLSNTTFV